MKKIAVILAILVSLLFAQVVYSYLYYRNFPFEVIVEPGITDVSVYHAESETQGVKIYMGRGSSHVTSLRIKNSGVEPLDLWLKAGYLDGEEFIEGVPWAIVLVEPAHIGMLNAYESANCTVSIYISTTTPITEEPVFGEGYKFVLRISE